MSGIIVSNRKAYHSFSIFETFEAGIQLKGTEVKSLRQGKASLLDAFAQIEKNELFLYGCHIEAWKTAANWDQHKAKRPRRLLMHKEQIFKLSQKVVQKGYTLVCLKLYWESQYVKAEIALAKGKNQADQRQLLKKREAMRETQRAISQFQRKS